MAIGHGEGIHGCIKAAESGDPKAQCALGGFYEHGSLGLKQNDFEAAKWYRKAAEQGHAGAQLYLGSLLAEGKGVEQDFIEAFKWVTLAKQGSAFDKIAATQAHKRLVALMTTEQIAEGQRLAREFIPKKAK